jgi:hypothetical protein
VAPMDERRKARRLRALKAGSISFIAPSGLIVGSKPVSGRCLLDVASQVGIPDVFVLGVSYDKFNAPCRIIWRSESRIGVQFRMA